MPRFVVALLACAAFVALATPAFTVQHVDLHEAAILTLTPAP